MTIGTTTPPAYDAEGLLDAGAVLPPGTEGAGERAVPLAARAYRHPALDDRVIVRLVPEELTAAEDLAAGFLGLVPEGEPAVVGLGERRALGFPEWVLAHHPEDGHHALAVVPELERAARQARSKPKAAMDACRRLADRLAASVPHFLPTFYEQAGRVFIAADNTQYAGQLFAAARTAEARHGLAVDEDRLDAVFLEFALAAALPVKVLSGYAKDLTARVPAEEALRRYTRLCLRRTAGGLAPSAQMAADIRRLAKAAGADADAAEHDYLAEVIALPAALRAAPGWWKAHAQAVAELAASRPGIRGTLLNMMPEGDDRELPGVWLDVLVKAGATAGLHADVPEEERSADGVAGWLRRFLAFRARTWGVPPHLPALNALIERAADRLRAGLGAEPLPADDDPDLLDLLLALGLPVADPGERATLRLTWWAEREDRRDLVALEADPRFRPAFRHAADRLDPDEDGKETVRALAASPGGRPMLTEWVRLVAAQSATAGLPTLPDALSRLTWLPGEALVLAEDDVRAAATGADVPGVLARALRAGIIDELAWPAFEEAAAELVPEKDVDDLVVCDAWPHLIVSGTAQARVLGGEGAVLTHDLRIPRADTWHDPGFHYVDGELLVYWDSRSRENGLRGYWHTAPDRVHDLDGRDRTRGTRLDYYRGEDPVSLAVPGGGRTTGFGVLRAGDTAVPDERPTMTDGTSFWARNWAGDRHRWHEFDPASGRLGREALPGFLADALRDAPRGSELAGGWVLPAPSGGLFGLRVVELPDGSYRAEDLSGAVVTVPAGEESPVRVLPFPGAERPCAVVRDGYRITLFDADGVPMAVLKTDGRPGAFGAGTLILPPERYWHYLRPRDPEGSAVLRATGRDTAAALIEAAAARPDDLPAAIRALLPGVTHEALLKGVAGVVAFAAVQQKSVRDVVDRLTGALTGVPEEEGPRGPMDELLADALNGLGGRSHYAHHYHRDAAYQQVRAIAKAVAGAPHVPGGAVAGGAERPATFAHLGLPVLPDTELPWWGAWLDQAAALAYRAASPTTPSEHRDALRELLRELRDCGLPGRWRRVIVRLGREHLTLPDGTWPDGPLGRLLPLGGGALLALVETRASNDHGCEWTALFHDPTGRFEPPAPYTIAGTSPLGADGDAARLETFLTELAERGPAPWHAEAAAEFARLTGVSETSARLAVAGFPQVDTHQRSFLDKDARTTLGVKVADAAVAKDELREIPEDVRLAVTAALLPADPARLWTDGPDVAAAAQVWNARVGRRLALPEWLLGEAARALKEDWEVGRGLRAVLDPAAAPELGTDLAWAVNGDRVRPDGDRTGFTGRSLVMAVTTAGWLAHRLPAGHPLRAGLPAALAAVRDRLAAPGLLLDLDRYVGLPEFRKAAGAPTGTGDGYERYGALVMATYDTRPSPAIEPALLDAAGDDPYLRALTGLEGVFPVAAALRTALDPRFAALLADPGDPEQGERDPDGTWWPQDPTRSVPGLVVEAAKEYGLGEDAAAYYLMLLAMPDPADRDVARWTGWRPARLKAAREELAATDLVVRAVRARAGRSLFLPGGWTEQPAPRLPVEHWKLSLFDTITGLITPIVPPEPVAALYARAWRRVRDGDGPRFQQLDVKRGRRR